MIGILDRLHWLIDCLDLICVQHQHNIQYPGCFMLGIIIQLKLFCCFQIPQQLCDCLFMIASGFRHVEGQNGNGKSNAMAIHMMNICCASNSLLKPLLFLGCRSKPHLENHVRNNAPILEVQHFPLPIA